MEVLGLKAEQKEARHTMRCSMWGHLWGIREEIKLIRAYRDIIRYLAVPKSSFFGDNYIFVYHI